MCKRAFPPLSSLSFSFIGSSEDYDVHSMECVGIAGYASCLAFLVRHALIRQLVLTTTSHILSNLLNPFVPLLPITK